MLNVEDLPDIEFESIRPYNNIEIQEAVKRLSQSPIFYNAVKIIFPELSDNEISRMLDSVKNCNDFQRLFMAPGLNRILSNSSAGLTYSGLENIMKGKAYLFIANHRDIFLDSGFLELILFENGFNTTQITFGSNLMSSQLIIDIGKINNMFEVKRGGDKIEMYNNSLQLSHYIRKTIEIDKESIWIAQRNGRTKDGNDKTQTGLLKMLNMSGKYNILENFSRINIIPLTISYEYEPCDLQKAKEISISSHKEYHKKPDEDLQNIISGVVDYKGKIHVAFGKQIDFESNNFAGLKTNNERYKAIAKEIDTQIYNNYKLTKNNYIAYDLLNRTNIYSNKYTKLEQEKFIKYLNNKLEDTNELQNEYRRLLLKIYASPIHNQIDCNR